MQIQRLLLVTAIVLSSNAVVSAQFSLRSLVDNLKTLSKGTDEEAAAGEEARSESIQGQGWGDNAASGSHWNPRPDSRLEGMPPSLSSEPQDNATRERIELDHLPKVLTNQRSPQEGSWSNPTSQSPAPTQHYPSGTTQANSGSVPTPHSSCDCQKATPALPHYRYGRCGWEVDHPIVCLDRPNLPPPCSPEDLYRTPLHFNNLWGDYLNEVSESRRNHYRYLLSPPKSMHATACDAQF